jgi:hypothetical protein
VDSFRDTFAIAYSKTIAFSKNLPYTLNSEKLVLNGGVIKHSSKSTVVKPHIKKIYEQRLSFLLLVYRQESLDESHRFVPDYLFDGTSGRKSLAGLIS